MMTQKPFCAIFPDDMIGMLAYNEGRNGFRVLIPPQRMHFLHEGKKSSYGNACFWFLGNFFEDSLNTEGTYVIEYLEERKDEKLVE